MPESRAAVVIEDDADIRSLLSDVLEQAGFAVHATAAGREGVEMVREHAPLVTTVDISLPGIDGFETAKRIREFSSTYLVMLTARTEEIDVVQSFDAGADDYVAKPFRPRELRARIEALLRRPRELATRRAVADPAGWIEHHGLAIEPSMHLATVDGADVELTRSEFDILVRIMTAGRRVVSKSELALTLRGDAEIGGFVSDHDSRAIEVHIANLRRKLGESPNSPRWIETVRGSGYRLTA